MSAISLSALLLIVFSISAAATWIIERACIQVGLYDWPGARKMQTIPIPRMGGLAIFGTSFAFALGFYSDVPRFQLVGALIVFLGGIFDDVRVVNSVIGKLFFQLPGAIIFAYGCDLSVLQIGALGEVALRTGIFGMVWFLTNAFNLMDNMNGLTAGLSAAILATLSLLAATTLHDPAFALYGLLVTLSTLGFAVRNFPGGKIYMGDQGSQFLGFFASSYAVLFWLKSARLSAGPHLIGTAVALNVLFFLFYFDVVSVVRIRLSEGRSPFVGDQCHISHRLAKSGWGPLRAVLILFAIELGLGVLVALYLS